MATRRIRSRQALGRVALPPCGGYCAVMRARRLWCAGGRRRGLAVVATALIWVVVIRGDDSARARPARAPGGEVPAAVRDLVDELTPEEKVDGMLLLGFEGDGRRRDRRGLPIASSGGSWSRRATGPTPRSWSPWSPRSARRAGRGQDSAPVRRRPGGRAVPRVRRPAACAARSSTSGRRRTPSGRGLGPGGGARAAQGGDRPQPLPGRRRRAARQPDRRPRLLRRRLGRRRDDRRRDLGCNAAEIACAPGHFPGQGRPPRTPPWARDGGARPGDAGGARPAPFQAAFAGAPRPSSSRTPSTPPTTRSPRRRCRASSPSTCCASDLGFRGVAITDDLGAGAIGARAAASGGRQRAARRLGGDRGRDRGAAGRRRHADDLVARRPARGSRTR